MTKLLAVGANKKKKTQLSGKYVSTNPLMRMSSKPGRGTIVCEEKFQERKVAAVAPANGQREDENFQFPANSKSSLTQI